MPDHHETSNEEPREEAVAEDTLPAEPRGEPLELRSPEWMTPDSFVNVDDASIEMDEGEHVSASPPAQGLERNPPARGLQASDHSEIEAIESSRELTAEANHVSFIADGEDTSASRVRHPDNDATQPMHPTASSERETPHEHKSVTTPAGESGGRGGWRERFRKPAGTTGADFEGTEPSSIDPNPSSAMKTNLQAIRRFFDPGLNGMDLRWARRTLGFAVGLIVVMLLANQAGAALIIASAVVPILIVLLLTAHDLYERESPVLLLGIGVAGGVVGILLGSIASWIVGSQWYDGGHLNFGAGGFGGKFADGTASFLVWLIVGLLLPAATVGGLAAAPLLLRRWPQFANEVMDGMILAGVSAAGLAVGYSSTFWWPMTYGDGPLMDVSEWTLAIAGQVLLRPLVITLSGALIGAGVWRYMLHPQGSVLLVLPAVSGVLGIMVLALGSLATQPAGIWPEFLLTLVLAGVVFAVYRRTLDSAIKTDAAAMGESGERMICPHCHLITPVGGYCGRCGKSLNEAVSA